jgi:hypothetical protein
MAADFVTNAQISVPLKTNLTADVDLGGLKFSYNGGIFYEPTDVFMPIKLPAPWPGTSNSTGANL